MIVFSYFLEHTRSWSGPRFILTWLKITKYSICILNMLKFSSIINSLGPWQKVPDIFWQHSIHGYYPTQGWAGLYENTMTAKNMKVAWRQHIIWPLYHDEQQLWLLCKRPWFTYVIYVFKYYDDANGWCLFTKLLPSSYISTFCVAIVYKLTTIYLEASDNNNKRSWILNF